MELAFVGKFFYTRALEECSDVKFGAIKLKSNLLSNSGTIFRDEEFYKSETSATISRGGSGAGEHIISRHC